MILLDYKDRRPIYEQVAEKLRDLMLKGVLEPDMQLPSVRSLATDLSINPNTIQRAYSQLEQCGYIYSVKGKGNFVADNSHIRAKRVEDALDKLGAAAREAFHAGIDKKEIINRVEEELSEGGSAE